MAGVPFVFGNATTSIPLSNLDADFNTPVTIGNTTVGLGNTVTTLGNVTLNNVTINSGLLSTATIPTANGTVMLSGNMPAFSAYNSSAQSLSASTTTKIVFNNKEFDTNNNFDSTTNYRFTPTVAGYYQINATVEVGRASSVVLGSNYIIWLYKNSSNYKIGNSINAGGVNDQALSVSSIVYFNGSTDYVEIYFYTSSNVNVDNNGTYQTWFNGSLVRSA